jgi:hypothetical protein
MVSFSRSGETLMLRSLNSHPELAVVHQLREPDLEADLEIFRHLKANDVRTLSPSHPLLRHRDDLDGVRALVLKNAVWEHAAPFTGFILVRNPLAVIASARTLNETPEARVQHREQARRWARGIDPRLLPFVGQTDSTTAFCALYTRKMTAAHATGLPIVRYEEFVAEPERILRRLLRHLGVGWDDAALRGHERFRQGEFGHGKIRLWEPIHDKSVEKYADLEPKIKTKIYALCWSAMTLYGYDFDGHAVTLGPIDDRFPGDG